MPRDMDSHLYDTSGVIDSTGSSNAYVVRVDWPINAYHRGMPPIRFKANFGNTGSATVNVATVNAPSGLGAVTLKKEAGAADLESGDLITDGLYTIAYDGEFFQVLELALPGTSTGGGNVIGPGSATDNAVARFNGTSGESIQNSGVIIDDSNNVSGVVALAMSGSLSGAVNVSQTGYHDLAEIASPSSPSANVARLHALDDASTTTLVMKDSAGNSAPLSHFKRAGTGAVVRTQFAKLSESISVMDFGAVADNSTDDATAFQAAIDYCEANGRALFVPSGNYFIGSALVINDDTGTLRIYGETSPRQFPQGTGYSCLRFAANVDGFVIDDSGNERLQGTTIEKLLLYKSSTDSKGSGSRGLEIIGARQAQFIDMLITGFDVGIHIDENTGTDSEPGQLHFDRVNVWNCATYQLDIRAVFSGWFSYCNFGGDAGSLDAQCRIRAGSVSGYADDLNFFRCLFIPFPGQAATYGVHCDSDSLTIWHSFIGCVFEGHTTAGIFYNKGTSTVDLNGVISLFVTECWFNQGAGATPISLVNTSSSIKANRIWVDTASNKPGVKVDATGVSAIKLATIITGNMISTNDGYCVELYKQDGAIVTHNVFEGFGTGSTGAIFAQSNTQNCILAPNTNNTGGTNNISGTGHAFQNLDGTVSLPAYTFADDTDTGIYRAGSGTIGISANGALVGFTDGSGIGSPLDIAVSADTGKMGYRTGSGGTVTQATSKTTAVTLNKPSGTITMNNAALAAGATASFNFNNNKLGQNDLLYCHHVNGGTAGAYAVRVRAGASGAGVAAIDVTNTTAGSLSEAAVLGFAIIKVATS